MVIRTWFGYQGKRWSSRDLTHIPTHAHVGTHTHMHTHNALVLVALIENSLVFMRHTVNSSTRATKD